MADRRMLTTKVTDDDKFIALSSSAQALYLHLSMCADDDGFCNQVSLAIFKAHASVQDLEALMEKRFIIQFEDGVIVIRHWRLANSLRNDRYKKTDFVEDLARLSLDEETKVYDWLPDGCQVAAERLPQLNLTKHNLTKPNSTEHNLTKEEREDTNVSSRKKFVPPTADDVEAYCQEQGYGINPDRFIDYYETNGWMAGKNHMKDWKAAVRNWERRRKEDGKPKGRHDDGDDFLTRLMKA